MKPISKFPSVDHVNVSGMICGWMYDFDVNRANPKPEHRTWLYDMLISPLKGDNQQMVRRQTCDGKNWHIWVLGGASRTGKAAYNKQLGMRRGEAVRDYLIMRMGHFDLPWNCTVHSMGESGAELFGRLDGIENSCDRGVLVMAKRVSSTIKNPPPPDPPKFEPPPNACTDSLLRQMKKYKFLPEEQEEAQELVKWWNEMKRNGKSDKHIREAIIEYLVDEYKDWLRLQDIARKEMCKTNPPKGIANAWGNPCRPRDYLRYYGTEISMFAIKLRLLRGSDECDQIYRWYFELRLRTTDIMRAMRAQALAMGFAAFFTGIRARAQPIMPVPKAKSPGRPARRVERRFAILKKRLKQKSK
jgi:hypothetical protein